MISKIKKPVSILLSLIMIVSLFTIVPFTASAAFGYSDLARGTLIQPGDSFYFDQIDSFKFADYNDPTIIHEVKGSDFSYNWTTLSVTDGYYSFGSTKLLPTSVSPGGLLIADYDSTTKMATFGVQNITHSFDETTGTLTVGGTGVVPRYFAFTGSDVGNVIFTQSNLVKHLIIDATDMIAIKQDAFMAYTGGCVLEDVEINSTSSTPLIIERNAVFYESGNTVTLTVNAVKLATVTNSPVDNYSTPVNLIYNVEQPITFKKNALTEPRDDLTVTFPAGCKIFIPGGPQFTYSWLQEEYDREAEYGYEEYFWRNHSDLVEGTDYVLGDARYEELTPLNASLVVGDSNTALFSAYTITDESVNGTVTASVNGTDVTEAAADADVLLTVAPDNGYQFKSISATYQKNKVEEFSDLVALMGDAVFSAATYADHPDYTCKVNDGKFVVYDGDTSVAELSEANMTNADLGGTYFSAQCGGLNWSLNFRNGSITDIYVYDSDYNYIFSSADGSKSTGTLPPAVLNLTTVTEGSQYSLTMPKMPVTVTAEFEEAPAPETFKVYVKKPTNETYTTIENLTGETTVAQLKEIIADQIDIPATAQRLIFAGKEILDDAKTLAECKIVDESTIHLVIRGYTVTWLNYDNSELGTTTVQYGSTPTYDGETPTKDADENYTYTFAGWKVGETTYALNEALPPVTGDVTYTATFDATAKVDDTVPESEFLTFTAVENNSSVTLNVYSGSNLLYNKNNSGWQSYTAGTQIALSNAGDSVRFRGKDTTFNDSNFVSIGGKVACSGNVMSLRLDDNGMVQGLSEQCFFCMFMGCTGLTAAPELPETMLAEGCYSYMFYGCTSLTTAPALPATNLAEACYYGMFYDCENLTTAPKLPATTLANECYNSMFEDCERLTTAPELPATTLAQYCYYHMFAGCSSIKLSETKTAEYSIPYSVPSGGNGTTASAALTGMFANTGGTFKGTPEINTTYYMYVPAPALAPVPYMAWDDTAKQLVEKTGDDACADYTVVADDTTAFEDGKWYVVSEDVTVADRITVSGTANLILCDGKTLTASNGITVETNNTLNIYAQSTGESMGKLTAKTTSNTVQNAVIGGVGSTDCGTVNIHCGDISTSGYAAYSAYPGAGIGGGGGNTGGAGGTVTIYGGKVTASGGYAFQENLNGSGIGGGAGGQSGGNGGTVTIYGGTVTASGRYGTGIGGGNANDNGGDGGTVIIYDGTVEASGSSGIGGGYGYSNGGNGGNVEIYGGKVTTGSIRVAGIGGGTQNADHGTLTVGRAQLVYGGNSENPTTIIKKVNNDYARYRYMTVDTRELADDHEHTFVYTASGNTITAACSVENCEFSGLTPITLTLEAPSPVYDGNPKEAVLSGYPDDAPQGLAAAPTGIVYYTATAPGSTETTGSALSGAPTDVGNYVAQVTWAGETLSVPFSIEYSLTINDGTDTDSNLPVYGSNTDHYQKSQFVIPASDLTNLQGNTLTGLEFYLSSKANKVWDSTFEVYLGPCDFDLFSSSSFADISEHTKVYTGTLDATGDTMNVVFDTGYTYTGGNLLVTFLVAERGTNYASASFYGVYDWNLPNYPSIYATSWSDTPTFNYPSGSYFVPKVTIKYSVPEPEPTYTVTWKNGDDVLETDTDVAVGATPSYDGAEPTKEADNDYTYTFSGWTSSGGTFYAKGTALPAVSGNETYTATFDAVAKNYFPFANLSLNGDIGVNFAIDTYGYDPEELRVNVSWYKYSNEYYFAGEDALPTREIGDKTYFIATANVAAKEMADTITVRLYKGDTELAAKTYSVRDYALTIINAENPGAIGLALSENKFAALKDLCKALLKYGSASEAQFDPQYPANIEAHTVDGIVISASDGVSYEGYNEAESPAYTVPDYSGFAEGLEYYGSSIGTKTTTNYLIAFVGSNAPSVQYKGATIDPVDFGTGGVAYNINGIAAKDITNDIVLNVNGEDVHFNMLAYITKALSVGDETLQSSVRALYDYGVKAKAYFNMAS